MSSETITQINQPPEFIEAESKLYLDQFNYKKELVLLKMLTYQKSWVTSLLQVKILFKKEHKN
jgi:hypothetical protein